MHGKIMKTGKQVNKSGGCRCAPMASVWRIATGLCVLLLAFGPGVLFLLCRANHAATQAVTDNKLFSL